MFWRNCSPHPERKLCQAQQHESSTLADSEADAEVAESRYARSSLHCGLSRTRVQLPPPPPILFLLIRDAENVGSRTRGAVSGAIYRSSGRKPVCFAISGRATGPDSSLSW